MLALVNWGGTFDSATGGTFQSDTGGTFHSDTPGTFESDMDGTFKVSQSDILTLEWDSIDMDAQLLRKCQYKTRQEVTVPLSPTAMDILRRWSGRRQRFVFRLLDPQTDMTDQKSLYAQRMSKTRSQNGVLCRIGKELNLNVSLTTHVARHTFAVKAINRGVSIYILSNLLGHSSEIATEKTYAKLLPKTLDVARSAIYGGK